MESLKNTPKSNPKPNICSSDWGAFPPWGHDDTPWWWHLCVASTDFVVFGRRYLWIGREEQPQNQVLPSFCSLAQTLYGWGSGLVGHLSDDSMECKHLSRKAQISTNPMKTFLPCTLAVGGGGGCTETNQPANNADEAGKSFHYTILPQICVSHLLLRWSDWHTIVKWVCIYFKPKDNNMSSDLKIKWKFDFETQNWMFWTLKSSEELLIMKWHSLA